MRPAALTTLLLASLLLASCAPTRSVSLRVSERDTGEPAPGAFVRATGLDAGMVPLPIDGGTIREILAENKVRAQAVVDRRGDAKLTLRSDSAYLVEALPSPMSPDAGAGAFERMAWLLPADGSSLQPAREGSEQWPLRLEVRR